MCVSGRLSRVRGGGGGVPSGTTPPFALRKPQIKVAVIAAKSGSQSVAKGRAMRLNRSTAKLFRPLRLKARRAKKPAMKKNSTMRNMCGM